MRSLSLRSSPSSVVQGLYYVLESAHCTVLKTELSWSPLADEPAPASVPLSMACGGLTVFSPMYRFGVKKGMKVGIAGLGGLGHFGESAPPAGGTDTGARAHDDSDTDERSGLLLPARAAVQFAAAMGAEVVVFTHQQDKVEDAKKMGASDVVLTTDKDWNQKYSFALDYLLVTIDVSKALPLTDLTSMLYVNGVCHLCCMPDDPIEAFQTQSLAANGASISVNHVGNKVRVRLSHWSSCPCWRPSLTLAPPRRSRPRRCSASRPTRTSAPGRR